MPFRCLIVDDNPAFLEAARTLLERQGLDVVGLAETAEEAVERVAELAPDVALLDVNLGEKSGFDVARQMSDTQVILISAYSEDDYAELIAASPAIGFVPKSHLSRRAIANVVANGRSSARRGT
jgi:two-component system, NarL family, nitrate/nitrite response regulator NarL